MRASEVLDIQGAIADELVTTSFKERCEFLMGLTLQPSMKEQLPAVMEQERIRMRAAHTFHVTEDMTYLVRSAALGLTQQEKVTLSFEPWTMPTEMGFVMFEKPVHDGLDFVIEDSEGRLFPKYVEEELGSAKRTDIEARHGLCGFSWGPAPVGFLDEGNLLQRSGEFKAGRSYPGLRLTFYATASAHTKWALDVFTIQRARTQERKKVLEADLAQIQEAYKASPAMAFAFGGDTVENVKKELRQADRVIYEMDRVLNNPSLQSQIGSPLVPVLTVAWPSNATTLDMAEVQSQQADAEIVQLVSLAWTFFHLSMQTIASREKEAAEKKVAKRWRKMLMPKSITVIRLRRAHSSRGEGLEGSIEWSHRWIVRGHWRMQACGPERSERRPTYIGAHVKGPEGLPLKQSNKVYNLER